MIDEMRRTIGASSIRVLRRSTAPRTGAGSGRRAPRGAALALSLVITSTLGALAVGGLSHVTATAPCGLSGTPGGTGPTFTCTYTFSGAADTFTVPAGVISATVDAFGAQGGNGLPSAPGGLGGETTATLAVTSGDVLEILVGGTGGTCPRSGSTSGVNGGGFNGGGNANPGTTRCSGAGGGASDLRTGACAAITPTPTCGLTDRDLVAGGGGGGGEQACSGCGNGGSGGGGAGVAGGGCDGSPCGGGGGGTQTMGGAAGAHCCGGEVLATAGTFGQGGTGGVNGCFCGAGAGGGGGGYYGGGGGGVFFVFGGGGGGGSGFGPSGATLTTGVHNGNGRVTITYKISPADLSITKSGPSVATQGVPFTYNLTVKNNGPADATGVTVTDTLPAAVTFVSATPGSCTQAAGTVTCALGSLANGGVVMITITVTPTKTSGTLVNSARVTGNETDPDLSNNTSGSVSTTVLAGSAACARAGDNGPPLAGAGTGLVSIATHVEPRTTDHPGSSFRDEVCIDDASGADDAPGVAGPTGTLTFFLCKPTQVAAFGCPVGAGTQVGKPRKVEDNDLMIKSPAVKPKALGTYCWLVRYSGDANFAPADSTNATTECFTVTASTHR